jgi:hypothetical protein
MSRKPVSSTLPGASTVTLTIEASQGTGSFSDRSNARRSFKYALWLTGEEPGLAIRIDDGSVCSFKPWPEPYSRYWSASGLVVQTPRQRIATAIYAIAREVLGPFGLQIAPSDELFPGGAALWRHLDPTITMEEIPSLPGFFRPALEQ